MMTDQKIKDIHTKPQPKNQRSPVLKYVNTVTYHMNLIY